MIEYAKDHAELKQIIEKERKYYKSPSYHKIMQKLGRKDKVNQSHGKLDAYYRF